MGQSVERTLKANEAIVRKGQATFMEVGEALAAIRDRKQYREAGFSSFDAYCQERWGFTANYARRQINAAEDAKSVPVGTLFAKTERAARAARKAAKPVIDIESKPQQLTIPWAVPHSQDAARLAHDDIATRLGSGQAMSFLRDEIKRIGDAAAGAVPATRQGTRNAASNGKCPHPKAKEDKKPYGVWCGACREKIR